VIKKIFGLQKEFRRKLLGWWVGVWEAWLTDGDSTVRNETGASRRRRGAKRTEGGAKPPRGCFGGTPTAATNGESVIRCELGADTVHHKADGGGRVAPSSARGPVGVGAGVAGTTVERSDGPSWSVATAGRRPGRADGGQGSRPGLHPT